MNRREFFAAGALPAVVSMASSQNPPRLAARLRRFSIDTKFLILSLNAFRDCRFFGLSKGEKIPDGATVESVYYSYDSTCLQMIVWHESYPIVPDGQEVPHEAHLGREYFHCRPIAEVASHTSIAEMQAIAAKQSPKKPLT